MLIDFRLHDPAMATWCFNTTQISWMQGACSLWRWHSVPSLMVPVSSVVCRSGAAVPDVELVLPELCGRGC